MNYGFPGLVWLLGFWLALVGLGYSAPAALLLALFGAVAGALVSVWWQLPPGDPSTVYFKRHRIGEPVTGKSSAMFSLGRQSLTSARDHRRSRRGRQEGLLIRLFARR